MSSEIQEWEKGGRIGKLVKALEKASLAEEAKLALIRLGQDSLEKVLSKMSQSLLIYKNFSSHSFDRKERVFQLHCDIVSALGAPALEEIKGVFQEKKAALASASYNYEMKGIMAFYLSVLGNDETVDILIGGLNQVSTGEALANLVNDERRQAMLYYRNCIISALAVLGNPKAIPVIYEDLKVLHGVSQGVLKKLTRLEDHLETLDTLKKSLSALTAVSANPTIKLFQESDNPELLETTMDIIALAKVPQAIPFLRQTIAEKAYKLKLKAAEGLVELGEKLSDSEVEALVSTYSPKDFPYTIPDIERKKAFFLLVGRTANPKAVEFLRSVMEKEKLNWEMQAPVFDGLGRARDKATTDFMLEQLESAGILTIEGIVKALGYTRDERVLDAIAGMMERKKNLSFDEGIRVALERLEAPEIKSKMLKFLDHEKACYRELGILGAGKFEIKEAVSRLIELYPDAGNSGKDKIIDALKYIGTPEAREFAEQHKSKCYIATAVYGGFEKTEVLTLRNFRDDILLQSRLGKGFVRFYYRVSPRLVRFFVEETPLHRISKRILDKIVASIIENDRY